MTVKEFYIEAIKNNHSALKLLIDYLVKEKKTIKLSDDAGAFDLYLQPRHQDKMNKLLKEYMQKSEG